MSHTEELKMESVQETAVKDGASCSGLLQVPITLELTKNLPPPFLRELTHMEE